MGAMSELDMHLQEIRRVMEDDMGDEPQTPREIAQVKVEMAARDAWLAVQDLAKLRNDPIAKPAFTPRVEADLWSAYNTLNATLTCIRCDNGEEPAPRTTPTFKPRVVSNG
jgi:hypothetical protein